MIAEKEVSLRHFRAMDATCAQNHRLRTLLGCVRLAQVLEDDNQTEIAQVAEQFGISADWLCSYVWLQTYIAELSSSSTEELPLEELAAELAARSRSRIGFDFAELDRYVNARAAEIGAEKLRTCMCDACAPSQPFPWETREAHLADLLDDAELQG